MTKTQKYGETLGREGLAILVKKIALEILDGSYKEAIIGAGKMQAVIKAATYDHYWGGKVSQGVYEGEVLLKETAEKCQ